jgi:signal transduction histidine kinase/CheY-like chemotaxis protein/HPt (histidine-containing phosphotransfer) domain-containing protein
VFHEQVDDLGRELRQLIAHPEEIRERLQRLLARVDTLAGAAAEAAAAQHRDQSQIDAVLDVMLSMAGLDFGRRAPVYGDGPLDALAQGVNMLSEELEAAQDAMSKARAAAEAATVAKSLFLAHMSHEIRTPLTALLGFADLLSVPTLSESDRLNYAMIIRRNGEHLLSVLNDVLDLSRIEAGRLSLEKIAFSPTQILHEVASLMRVRARESGLEFSVALDTPVPARISGDPTRVRQILLNLVGNAIKFTRQGEVAVRVRLDGASLVFAVADTGIGIAADQQAVLFQPFQQGDRSMTRRYGGSGLGLSISRALAEALGGVITVESTPGRGSTFRLVLPVEPGGPMVDHLDVEPRERLQAHAAVRFSGSVLVAEDGVDNQVLITMLLRGYGLTVAVVADGQTAIERALDAARNGTPFDLVLMDMQMPVVDGYLATSELRKAGYDKPIVALTAHAMAGERERCLACGCDDYVRKPIERAELVAALARILPAAPDDEGPLHSSYAADPAMQPLIARFVRRLPDRVAALRVESRAPGSEKLSLLLHRLKGAAGGFGYQPISAAAAAVEQLLREGREHALVLRALDQLFAACARVA